MKDLLHNNWLVGEALTSLQKVAEADLHMLSKINGFGYTDNPLYIWAWLL